MIAWTGESGVCRESDMPHERRRRDRWKTICSSVLLGRYDMLFMRDVDWAGTVFLGLVLGVYTYAYVLWRKSGQLVE